MIDRAVFDELARSIGDDPEFLRELVETYLDDSPLQLAALRAGIAGGDLERAHRAAHTLKSNSASVGALGLAEMCRQLEALTQPATTDAADLAGPDLAARADAIATELRGVEGELKALVAEAAR